MKVINETGDRSSFFLDDHSFIASVWISTVGTSRTRSLVVVNNRRQKRTGGEAEESFDISWLHAKLG